MLTCAGRLGHSVQTCGCKKSACKQPGVVQCVEWPGRKHGWLFWKGGVGRARTTARSESKQYLRGAHNLILAQRVLRGEVPGEISWHGLDGQTDRGLEENRPANQEGRAGKHHQATPAQPHKQKLAETGRHSRHKQNDLEGAETQTHPS